VTESMRASGLRNMTEDSLRGVADLTDRVS